ncbi:MAG: hypothetical protein L3K13_08485 [Thermoplasmata archaeon]|nr:hypothetical protein [Thermoplasmata archaeon]
METLRLTRGKLAAAGFRIVGEVPCGFAEFRPFRGFPAEMWVKVSSSFRTLPFAPSVFLVADRLGPTFD